MATLDQLSFEDIEKLMDLARETPIFRKISLAERQELLEKATISAPVKGEYIFFADDKPDLFFLLYSGSLFEFALDGNTKKILRIIKPGNFFGITGVIDGTRYGTTVKALNDSSVVSFPREDLINLLQKYPDLKKELL